MAKGMKSGALTAALLVASPCFAQNYQTGLGATNPSGMDLGSFGTFVTPMTSTPTVEVIGTVGVGKSTGKRHGKGRIRKGST